MEFLKNKYFKFGLMATIYILFVIWLQNFWWLFGLIVIFDIYITEKINWTPWKKRHGKNSTLVEWIDALIFAVIAVTIINIFLFQNYKIPTGSMEKSLLIGDHLYVSKVAYGPRVPNTPLAFPFAQHTMPLTEKTKSYLEWIQLPYKRLAGFGDVKRDDAVVFNFPAGDTVVVQMQAQSYYSIILGYAEQFRQRDISANAEPKPFSVYKARARQYIWDNYDIVARPVDRRDNYIKRCVALPGDDLEIINRKIHVNGEPQKEIEGIQFKYWIKTNQPFNPKTFERLDISSNDIKGVSSSDYHILMSEEKAEKVAGYANVDDVQVIEKPEGQYANYIFPHSPDYPWNEDNFGPLHIPAKGETVELTIENLPLYERIIDQYEDNDLAVRDSVIYINGEVANTYTFEMDYYFMVGDNRHDSADSRFWGFVPEDHIVGKPKFIWLSLDKDKSFPMNIRLRRMFMRIR
ncbi:MAG: S26 family signal peptidase [Bacteroidota bacterium]